MMSRAGTATLDLAPVQLQRTAPSTLSTSAQVYLPVEAAA